MENKKRIILSALGILILVITIVGISYAMFTFAGTGTKENTINVGKISISYNENTLINLNGSYPMTDVEGINNTDSKATMDFNIISDIVGNQTINYAIAIYDITEGATLKDENIKIYIYKNNTLVSGFEEGIGKAISEFEPYYIEGEINMFF